MENDMDTIETMIDYIAQGEFQKANSMFGDAIGSRITDALDQEKIAVADQFFNGVEPDEDDDDQLELDLDDEELDIDDEDLEDDEY